MQQILIIEYEEAQRVGERDKNRKEYSEEPIYVYYGSLVRTK